MPRPPQPPPFLTREEMEKMTDDQKRRRIAELSSYNFGRKMEQQAAIVRKGHVSTSSRRWGVQGSYSQRFHPYQRQERGDTHGQASNSNGLEEKSPVNCIMFTRTGTCKRSSCKYTHDPEKTAICKVFLSKGSCSVGDICPLSHQPSPNCSPTCIHFLRDNCTNEKCRYAHVSISPRAPVCDTFARLGYCDKGAECSNIHTFECPDFVNKGTCNAKHCRLPHVTHAGRLRRVRSSLDSSDAESPMALSSPENGNLDTESPVALNSAEDGNLDGELSLDIKSEADFNTKSKRNNDTVTELSQQADYVPFDS
ncbi:hypothetical protein K469DRAFT_686068 [Zopfia rhizophila CBS 207.26]|uniref:C3H1-type domain-containing protein n=1 Tax=Zopfia rhizophila CBS 207.26 TaxID=1314779 RepID=A0A6A6E8C8_9PEZI|nr:hypothetical protein K469DRAFT_686068 [Zopfia rhizophila CBS 207.26]